MARGDVADLMRHHAGKLGFAVGGKDRAFVDEEETAGQGEGIDVVGIDHLDCERYLRI